MVSRITLTLIAATNGWHALGVRMTPVQYVTRNWKQRKFSWSFWLNYPLIRDAMTLWALHQAGTDTDNKFKTFKSRRTLRFEIDFIYVLFQNAFVGDIVVKKSWRTNTFSRQITSRFWSRNVFGWNTLAFISNFQFVCKGCSIDLWLVVFTDTYFLFFLRSSLSNSEQCHRFRILLDSSTPWGCIEVWRDGNSNHRSFVSGMALREKNPFKSYFVLLQKVLLILSILSTALTENQFCHVLLTSWCFVGSSFFSQYTVGAITFVVRFAKTLRRIPRSLDAVGVVVASYIVACDILWKCMRC